MPKGPGLHRDRSCVNLVPTEGGASMDKARRRELDRMSREELLERLKELEEEMEELYRQEPEDEDEEHEDWEDELDDLRDEQDELTERLRR